MFGRVLLFLAAPHVLSAANPSAASLGEPRFDFCHNDSYSLSAKEARFCPLVGDVNDVCPALPRACKRPVAPIDVDVMLEGGSDETQGEGDENSGTARQDGDADGDAEGRAWRDNVRFHYQPGESPGSGGASPGSANSSGQGAGNGGPGDPRNAGPQNPAASPSNGATPRDPKSPQNTSSGKTTEPPPPPPPDGMSMLAQVLLILLVAGGLVALGRAIAKHLSWGKKKDDETDEPEEQIATKSAAKVRDQGPIETDVQKLLRLAQAAAARGDFTKAVENTYAALLRRLDGAGFIEIHPSRTNGDYVRALAEHPELKSEVRKIVSDVERVQFGSLPANANVFQSLFGRIAPIATRALGVVLLFFMASTVVSCKGENRAVPTALDMRPYGTAALQEVVTHLGRVISHRKAALSSIDDESTSKVLVLMRGAAIDRTTWMRILDWTERGGTLVVAGVRHLPRELLAEPTDDTNTATTLERRGDYEVYPFTDFEVAAPSGTKLKTSIAPSRWVLARGDEPYAVETPYGSGRVYVFAERALFTNISFAVADNAAFITTFINRLNQEEIEICDTWTGAGAGSPIDSIRKARLSAVVAQLLALALLFLVWKGAHFGQSRDPTVRSRRAFADHVRALGHIYARAKASEHALGNFSAWAIERLRERFYRGQRAGLSPLAEAIGAATGKNETAVLRVLLDAQSARESAGPPSSFRSGSMNSSTTPKKGAEEANHLGTIRMLFDLLRTKRERAKRP